MFLIINILAFNQALPSYQEQYTNEKAEVVDFSLYGTECKSYSIKVKFKDSRKAMINVNTSNCELNEYSVTPQKSEHSGLLDPETNEIKLTYCVKSSIVNIIKIPFYNNMQINCIASETLKCDSDSRHK